MHTQRKFFYCILLCLSACWLAACAFSLRSLNDLPTGLYVMGIQKQNAYAELTSAVQRALTDVGVKIVPPENAAYSLILEDTDFKTDMPIRFNSSVATNYTYTLSVRVGIQDKAGHLVIPPTSMTASETIAHNVNQIDSPVMIRVVRQELIRTLTQRIYTWLTSPGLKTTLVNPLPQPRASTSHRHS